MKHRMGIVCMLFLVAVVFVGVSVVTVTYSKIDLDSPLYSDEQLDQLPSFESGGCFVYDYFGGDFQSESAFKCTDGGVVETKSGSFVDYFFEVAPLESRVTMYFGCGGCNGRP